MAGFRTCDVCQVKLPFGRRRNKVNDKMLCDGCTEGKPGRPGFPATGAKGKRFTVQCDHYENRHWVMDEGKHTGPPLSSHAQAVRKAKGMNDDHEDNQAAWSPKEAAMDARVDLEHCESCLAPIGDAGLIRRMGMLVCADGCKTAAKHVAHDPGDPAVVAHCPTCGSGSVTRRSDGSVECDFCGGVFTIWAQPKFPAMPQTSDGQPVDIPGMPPREQASPVGPDGFAPAGTGAPSTGFAPAGGGPVAVPDAQPKRVAPVPGVAPVPPQKNPMAATSALYLTDDGVAIGEDSYLARLALEVADDREAVLLQVRASRKR